MRQQTKQKTKINVNQKNGGKFYVYDIKKNHKQRR